VKSYTTSIVDDSVWNFPEDIAIEQFPANHLTMLKESNAKVNPQQSAGSSNCRRSAPG
jgi:hypothetical protein